MSKEVIYKTKTCKKCGNNYITITTIYNSQQGTLYTGDTGNCDARIADLCDECIKQVKKEMLNT